jgi:hypothetical protein
MKSVFNNWFECEEGHVTVGDNIKKSCDAELWEMKYEKGKRKKNWKLEPSKTSKTCGKHIVAQGEIPRVLDYSTVWDYKTAHAFCCGQTLDSEFIIGLQTEISEIWKKIGGKDVKNT